MRKLSLCSVVVTPLVAAVLLSTGGCSSTPEVNLAAEEKAIRSAEAEFSQAAAAKDLEKAVAFYADDAVMLPPGEPIASGKAAVRAGWTQMFATPDLALTWEVTKIDVAKSGDMAFDYGTYSMSYKNAAGRAEKDHGKYATVWKKQADGAWKVALDTNCSDLPPVKAVAAKKAAPKAAAPKAKRKR